MRFHQNNQHMNRKLHYKMYKSGKFWMFAGLTMFSVISVGGYQTAKADTTTDSNNSSATDSNSDSSSLSTSSVTSAVSVTASSESVNSTQAMSVVSSSSDDDTVSSVSNTSSASSSELATSSSESSSTNVVSVSSVSVDSNSTSDTQISSDSVNSDSSSNNGSFVSDSDTIDTLSVDTSHPMPQDVFNVTKTQTTQTNQNQVDMIDDDNDIDDGLSYRDGTDPNTIMSQQNPALVDNSMSGTLHYTNPEGQSNDVQTIVPHYDANGNIDYWDGWYLWNPDTSSNQWYHFRTKDFSSFYGGGDAGNPTAISNVAIPSLSFSVNGQTGVEVTSDNNASNIPWTSPASGIVATGSVMMNNTKGTSTVKTGGTPTGTAWFTKDAWGNAISPNAKIALFSTFGGTQTNINGQSVSNATYLAYSNPDANGNDTQFRPIYNTMSVMDASYVGLQSGDDFRDGYLTSTVTANGQPELVAYVAGGLASHSAYVLTSTDGQHWTNQPNLEVKVADRESQFNNRFSGQNGNGITFETPHVSVINGQPIMFFGSQYTGATANEEEAYVTGSLNQDGIFQLTDSSTAGTVDNGFDNYAGNFTKLDDNHQVYVGWVGNWAYGWTPWYHTGGFTIPTILSYDSTYGIQAVPVDPGITTSSITSSYTANSNLSNLTDNQKVIFKFQKPTNKFSFTINRAANNSPTVTLSYDGSSLHLFRNNDTPTNGSNNVMTLYKTIPIGSVNFSNAEFYLDNNILDIYLPDVKKYFTIRDFATDKNGNNYGDSSSLANYIISGNINATVVQNWFDKTNGKTPLLQTDLQTSLQNDLNKYQAQFSSDQQILSSQLNDSNLSAQNNYLTQALASWNSNLTEGTNDANTGNQDNDARTHLYTALANDRFNVADTTRAQIKTQLDNFHQVALAFATANLTTSYANNYVVNSSNAATLNNSVASAYSLYGASSTALLNDSNTAGSQYNTLSSAINVYQNTPVILTQLASLSATQSAFGQAYTSYTQATANNYQAPLTASSAVSVVNSMSTSLAGNVSAANSYAQLVLSAYDAGNMTLVSQYNNSLTQLQNQNSMAIGFGSTEVSRINDVLNALIQTSSEADTNFGQASTNANSITNLTSMISSLATRLDSASSYQATLLQSASSSTSSYQSNYGSVQGHLDNLSNALVQFGQAYGSLEGVLHSDTTNYGSMSSVAQTYLQNSLMQSLLTQGSNGLNQDANVRTSGSNLLASENDDYQLALKSVDNLLSDSSTLTNLSSQARVAAISAYTLYAEGDFSNGDSYFMNTQQLLSQMSSLNTVLNNSLSAFSAAEAQDNVTTSTFNQYLSQMNQLSSENLNVLNSMLASSSTIVSGVSTANSYQSVIDSQSNSFVTSSSALTTSNSNLQSQNSDETNTLSSLKSPYDSLSTTNATLNSYYQNNLSYMSSASAQMSMYFSAGNLVSSTGKDMYGLRQTVLNSLSAYQALTDSVMSDYQNTSSQAIQYQNDLITDYQDGLLDSIVTNTNNLSTASNHVSALMDSLMTINQSLSSQANSMSSLADEYRQQLSIVNQNQSLAQTYLSDTTTSLTSVLNSRASLTSSITSSVNANQQSTSLYLNSGHSLDSNMASSYAIFSASGQDFSSAFDTRDSTNSLASSIASDYTSNRFINSLYQNILSQVSAVNTQYQDYETNNTSLVNLRSVFNSYESNATSLSNALTSNQSVQSSYVEQAKSAYAQANGDLGDQYQKLASQYADSIQDQTNQVSATYNSLSSLSFSYSTNYASGMQNYSQTQSAKNSLDSLISDVKTSYATILSNVSVAQSSYAKGSLVISSAQAYSSAVQSQFSLADSTSTTFSQQASDIISMHTNGTQSLSEINSYQANNQALLSAVQSNTISLGNHLNSLLSDNILSQSAVNTLISDKTSYVNQSQSLYSQVDSDQSQLNQLSASAKSLYEAGLNDSANSVMSLVDNLNQQTSMTADSVFANQKLTNLMMDSLTTLDQQASQAQTLADSDHQNVNQQSSTLHSLLDSMQASGSSMVISFVSSLSNANALISSALSSVNAHSSEVSSEYNTLADKISILDANQQLLNSYAPTLKSLVNNHPTYSQYSQYQSDFDSLQSAVVSMNVNVSVGKSMTVSDSLTINSLYQKTTSLYQVFASQQASLTNQASLMSEAFSRQSGDSGQSILSQNEALITSANTTSSTAMQNYTVMSMAKAYDETLYQQAVDNISLASSVPASLTTLSSTVSSTTSVIASEFAILISNAQSQSELMLNQVQSSYAMMLSLQASKKASVASLASSQASSVAQSTQSAMQSYSISMYQSQALSLNQSMAKLKATRSAQASLSAARQSLANSVQHSLQVKSAQISASYQASLALKIQNQKQSQAIVASSVATSSYLRSQALMRSQLSYEASSKAIAYQKAISSAQSLASYQASMVAQQRLMQSAQQSAVMFRQSLVTAFSLSAQQDSINQSLQSSMASSTAIQSLQAQLQASLSASQSSALSSANQNAQQVLQSAQSSVTNQAVNLVSVAPQLSSASSLVQVSMSSQSSSSSTTSFSSISISTSTVTSNSTTAVTVQQVIDSLSQNQISIVAQSSSSVTNSVASSSSFNDNGVLATSSQVAKNYYYYVSPQHNAKFVIKVGKKSYYYTTHSQKRFKVLSYRKLSNGQVKYQVQLGKKKGTLTTKQPLTNAYLTKDGLNQKYYVAKNTYAYRSVRFTKANRVKKITGGTLIDVQQVVNYHGMIRIKLSDGTYMTGLMAYLDLP